jgi:hypothetical protein
LPPPVPFQVPIALTRVPSTGVVSAFRPISRMRSTMKAASARSPSVCE